MNTDELKAEVARMAELTPWYHCIPLSPEVTTPGWEGISPIWENIRKVRAPIDYFGKRVLDLGSRDGMWAFEAEHYGAAKVVATDMGCDRFHEHILFVKSVLKSRASVFFNVPVEDLFRRLDMFFLHDPGLFDIVQHLGLFYHLSDPVHSLRQSRLCIKPGGTLLLETAFYRGGGELPIALFNSRSQVYDDKFTHWAYNETALFDALRAAGFEPNAASVSIVDQTEMVGRICLTAKAV